VTLILALLENLVRTWDTLISTLMRDREERGQIREQAEKDAALDPKTREQRKQDLARARSRPRR